MSPSPPSFDAELGQIFIRMRTLLGVNLWDMARAVGGEPTVIANLEAGALDALPPWPELTRLVDQYAHLTGLDPQPILSRLLRAQSAPVELQRTAPPEFDVQTTTPWPMETYANASPRREMHAPRIVTAAPQVIAPKVPVTAEVMSEQSRRRAPGAARGLANSPGLAEVAEAVVATARPRRVAVARPRTWRLPFRIGRRMLVLSVLVLGVISILFAARVFPGALYATIGPLPSLVGSPLRHGVNALVGALAPVREGLTWIDVGDPRLRRSDKLPQRGR